MKPLLKNFLSVIRRYKLAVALNILGLSVAFAAFMVIMAQVDFDISFDKCHKDHDKIFRVEIYAPFIATAKIPILPRPFADQFFESSPHIVAGALTTHTDATHSNSRGAFEASFHIETEGSARNFFKENSLAVSPEFFDVFTFDFVEGSVEALSSLDKVVIPLSMAHKLFGKESAIDKQLIYEWGRQTVGAVYSDFPLNTIIENCLYFTIPPEHDRYNWRWNYNAFIRVNDASKTQMIVDNFLQNFDFSAAFGHDFSLEESGFGMFLTPLADIHFTTDIQFDFAPKASKQTLMILFAIAIVIKQHHKRITE